MARGWERVLQLPFPTALILMGDWCGPCYGAVTPMIENQGAELKVPLLQPRARKREHKKVFREWCDVLTRAF